MRSDVDAAQADCRNGYERGDSARSAQLAERCDAEGDRDPGVPGDVPQPGRFRPAAVRTLSIERARAGGGDRPA